MLDRHRMTILGRAGLDRTCAKCGLMNCDMAYDRNSNRILLRCPRCGYNWSETPLDAHREHRV